VALMMLAVLVGALFLFALSFGIGMAKAKFMGGLKRRRPKPKRYPWSRRTGT